MQLPMSMTRKHIREPLRSTASSDSAFEINAEERNYQTQFANIYFLRLAALKPRLRALATDRWSMHATETNRVLDVVQGEMTWVVGTVYMDMPLKPQVLQDLVADINLASAVPAGNWRDPRLDVIQLEDESGRLTIIGHKLSEQVLCTGTVLAVLGTETASGEFDVIDILYPTSIESIIADPGLEAKDDNSHNSSLQSERHAPVETHHDHRFVAIVSGLELSDSEQTSLGFDLLTEYLTGELFGADSHEKLSKVSSLIILGNSIGASSSSKEDAMSRKLAKNKKYGYDAAAYNSRPIEMLDSFIEEICKSIDVVLIPGDQDPTNITLPQKAINKIMLQRSSCYAGSTLRLATNPTYLTMGDRSVFCTAGQTIDDLKHYIEIGSPDDSKDTGDSVMDVDDVLDLAQETLRWAHFAPTAPDTLWTYPFSDRDPFVIDKYPEMYIIGNQERFGHRSVQIDSLGKVTKCSITLIPRFSTTGQVVLIDQSDLSAQVISFPVTA